MGSKFEITEYFTDRQIIKILCKKRALAAKKSHDNHFLRNISTSAKNPNVPSKNIIHTFFPPRRDWIRAKKLERLKRNANAVELNAILLERTVFRAMKEFKNNMQGSPKWLLSITDLVKDIQCSALNEMSEYVIPKPIVIPVLKDLKKKEYRPICSFGLKDLVIISQVAKYLTNCFDQLFLPCSYAFRTGVNSPKKFNHHQAVRDIIEFNNEAVIHYVAECDIKKFYDCVSHSEIKYRMDQFIVRAQIELGITISERSKYLFSSYLACFSFNLDVAQKETTLLKNAGVKSGSMPWASKEEFERINIDINEQKIGVPQGGALSCLIANLILDYVDRQVLAKNDTKLFYARFCDDMVLIHSDLDLCNSAFDVYRKSLREVKLICHEPEELKEYNSNFWKIKSKFPYKWDEYENSIEKKANVPWLSFVGYQVRWDNLVRIRKTSIEKELKKQVDETNKIFSVLGRSRKSRVNRKAVVFRLQQRLISMSVGRIQHNNSRLSMCWSAGFNVAKDNKNIKAQFIKLDRNRERQIKRMYRFVSKIDHVVKTSKHKVRRLKYYGKRFSYSSQFNQ